MICEIREDEVVLHHPTIMDALAVLYLVFAKDKELCFTKPKEGDADGKM